MLGVGQNIFDIFYPIGSYYETSDTTFNPNTAHSWYGTWVEDTAGRVLVAQDTTQTEFDVVGETGGAKSVTLNAQQIPAHHHGQTIYWSGGTTTNQVGVAYDMKGQTNNKFWASYDNEGGGRSHNNLQPYIVIKRWHRIA